MFSLFPSTVSIWKYSAVVLTVSLLVMSERCRGHSAQVLSPLVWHWPPHVQPVLYCPCRSSLPGGSLWSMTASVRVGYLSAQHPLPPLRLIYPVAAALSPLPWESGWPPATDDQEEHSLLKTLPSLSVFTWASVQREDYSWNMAATLLSRTGFLGIMGSSFTCLIIIYFLSLKMFLFLSLVTGYIMIWLLKHGLIVYTRWKTNKP